ncbi:MAG: alpha/beta fold hydrolase [Actinobacteria bacterium]|nr:MAG: alpha/beta fold hydrolase [Actinomycetota bacterium]
MRRMRSFGPGSIRTDAVPSGSVELPDGGRLAFDVEGDGPDVVLLHPGLWDRRTWDRQMTTFPAAGFRVTRYDARGYGDSTRPDARPYSHVHDLAALIDALGISLAALVGCSMGGSIGIDFTLEHPERVWALVPVAAGLGGFELLEQEEDWWAAATAPVDEALEAGDLERAEDARLAIWAPLGAHDPAGALVVEAEHDPPFSRRESHLIATGILDAQRVTIEGADHVVNLRQPERFDEAVLAFLAAVRPEH